MKLKKIRNFKKFHNFCLASYLILDMLMIWKDIIQGFWHLSSYFSDHPIPKAVWFETDFITLPLAKLNA